ncbi:MAG TPA: hypothetical protein VIO94_05465 [Phenylobacterium sp.]
MIDAGNRGATPETKGQALLEFARLAALVVVDLIKPTRPENRLPKRWQASPRRL